MSETVIAVVSGVVGFVAKSAWDIYFARRTERDKLALAKKVDRFELTGPVSRRKDTVIWKRILDVREDHGSLKQRVGSQIERGVILPNHEEIVKIIESRIHLAQPDEEFADMLLQYMNHVAVYKALRDAGEEKIFPLELHEPYPQGLFAKVEDRTFRLQEKYDEMIKVFSTPDIVSGGRKLAIPRFSAVTSGASK